MYGLKSDIDLSFLVGREIIQISVGKVQVILSFDHNTAISVEQRFEYRADGRSVVWKPGKMDAAGALLELIGGVVKSVGGETNGTLTLEFLAGEVLIVMDASEEFESYTITQPGSTIVV
jgi:hypothetical protein